MSLNYFKLINKCLTLKIFIKNFGGFNNDNWKYYKFKHKFAKKPEVIDGNMKALELALKEVKKIWQI